jgi:hypothetical protein
MSTCAVIEIVTGKVINVIVAEETDTPPLGCRLLLMQDNMHWDNENQTIFIDPVSSENP